MKNNKIHNKSQINYNNKILQVNNLKTHFKVGSGKNKIKVKAVDDISFNIYEREVFGIVGESGSGKTTASRTIIRLYRPTGGNVLLEGQVIGSGNDEFYSAIKDKKSEYLQEKIKLNSRKFAISEIEASFDLRFETLDKKKETLVNKYEEDIKQINEPIELFKNSLFKEKSDFRLEKENALFEYNREKDITYLKTRNEFEDEYAEINKYMAKSLKNKIKGLDQSAGLDEASRNLQKDELKKQYEIDLASLETEYKEKIKHKATNIISMESYKEQLVAFKLKYVERIDAAKKKFSSFKLNKKKPKFVEIQKKLLELRSQHNKELAKLNEERKVLKQLLKTEIKAVPKEANIDVEKLKILKSEYKSFVVKQKELVRASKKAHHTKEAKNKTKRMQMIFQDPISSLNPRMTVGEIVAEGLVINGEKDKIKNQEKVIETLKLVGLAPEYISRYPHEFSGGQRQRIGIARALIMNPSFIIADEPISALDVSIRAQVLNLLNDLKEKLDLTILFIAHDLSVVKFFCDRIAVMYSGKIVELADNEELFKNPLHPYTKSLLSAIPQPDPDSEKLRKRITYRPDMHDYSKDLPELKEITKGHFVYCNNAEFERLKQKGDENA